MGSLFEGPQISQPRSVSNLGQPIRLPEVNLQPVNFSAGGLTSNLNNNRLTLNSSGQRQGIVNNLAGTSLNQANEIAGLRSGLTDAVTGLRASRLAENENRRRASVSNLRDNLARRRVLGSSFGADAVTRADLEFAQEADRIDAESRLAEIDASAQLINQEFTARSNAFATQLNELNLQAEVAGNLLNNATGVMQTAAQLRAQLAGQQMSNQTQRLVSAGQLDSTRATNQAKLDAEAQAGAGQFFGRLGGLALAPFTGGASLGLFG